MVLADELRPARQGAGLSQESVGRAVGVSGAHVARLERAAVPGASVILFARLFAVLGLRLSSRPYPVGPPIRDAAHARLLTRFRAELAPGMTLRTEVPLGSGPDLRAWDGQIDALSRSCKLEAETVLSDMQETKRRIALKMADDSVERVILLVADTHRNRRVLREFRELFRARFPLDTRAIMRQLRSGQVPEQSGIVLR